MIATEAFFVWEGKTEGCTAARVKEVTIQEYIRVCTKVYRKLSKRPTYCFSVHWKWRDLGDGLLGDGCRCELFVGLGEPDEQEFYFLGHDSSYREASALHQ